MQIPNLGSETPVVEKRNGCFNHSPFKKSMVVQAGWYTDLTLGRDTRLPKMTIIKVGFLQGCQYSIHTVDRRCIGCIHNQQPK